MALEREDGVHRMRSKFDQVNGLRCPSAGRDGDGVLDCDDACLMTSPRPSLGYAAVGSPTLTTTRVASSIA